MILPLITAKQHLQKAKLHKIAIFSIIYRPGVVPAQIFTIQ